VLITGTIALFMGLIFSKTMFRKQRSFFIIEMVNWRTPDFIIITKLALIQIFEFIKKCSTIIIGVGLLI
jgi:ferrous iron transport protein B